MGEIGPRGRKSLRECLRNFVPAWHTVVMGTGVVNGIINNFPFFPHGPGRNIAMITTFSLALSFFVVIIFATIARYALFKKLLDYSLHHPEGLFVGTIFIGVTTLLNGSLAVYNTLGCTSHRLLYALWGIWWLNSAMSLIISAYTLHLMVHKHFCSLEDVTPAYMMPYLPLVVSSSTGGLFALALTPVSYTHTMITIETSITMLCASAVPVSLVMIAYLFRLVTLGVPKPDVVLTANIPFGPLGQGALGFLYNGMAFSQLSSDATVMPSGQAVYTLCICIGWVLWAIIVLWAFTVFCVVLSTGIRRIPFNLGFWGTIFPNGDAALCSMELGVILQNNFLLYFGAIWGVYTMMLWCYAFCMSIPAIWNTSIFSAPGIDECIDVKEGDGSIISPLHEKDESSLYTVTP